MYKKPTFTGGYIRWNFLPPKRKINFISTLLHRPLAICYQFTLPAEPARIRSIFWNSGYPDHVDNTVLINKCPVFLQLSGLGYASWKFELRSRQLFVKRCFFAIRSRVVYATRQILSATNKEVLSASHHSNVIYQFLCHCDSRYVDSTCKWLQQSIKQDVPKSILYKHIPHDRRYLSHSSQSNMSPPETLCSTIGQHLLQNLSRAIGYHKRKFSIFTHGRTAFHLSTLAATYIIASKPDLCKQKKFVYSLKLSH